MNGWWAVAAPELTFLGKQKKMVWGGGGKKVQNCALNMKKLPFYAEIVKFGLILTHLKLFFGRGEKWDERKYLGGDKCPHVPYGTVTVGDGL